jgi:hypothetical protein
LKITAEDLRNSNRKTTMFADMARGGAMQSGHLVQHPRVTWVWQRQTRTAQGVLTYAVDGVEVGSLAEAARRLNEPVPA